MSQSEDSFIGRWSRRKKEARSPVTDPAQPQIDPESPEPASIEDDISDAESGNAGSTDVGNVEDNEKGIPTDDDMVALETLDADSDYSLFMSEGVSSELRKAALKKLFFSGKFSVRDGLDDYDDDFTQFEPLGDTVTSDMKYHARRKEKERLARLEEEQVIQEKQALEDQADRATDEHAESDSTEIDTSQVEADAANDDGELDNRQQPEPAGPEAETPEAETPEADSPDAETPEDSGNAEIHLSSVEGDSQQFGERRHGAKPGSAKNSSDSGKNT